MVYIRNKHEREHCIIQINENKYYTVDVKRLIIALSINQKWLAFDTIRIRNHRIERGTVLKI